MAWTTPKDAVVVTERQWTGVVLDEQPLRTTSTTTILRAGPLFGSDQLRMFGDMAGGAKTTMGGTGANAVWVDEDLEGGAALVGQPGCDPLSFAAGTNGGFAIPFTWIESGGVFDVGSLTLEMDERRLTDRTTLAVRSTCVPRFAQGGNWPWDQRVIDTAACTYTPKQSVTNFYVFYKDACVVPVPAETYGLRVFGVDGKVEPAPTVAWLMIVARVQVALADAPAVPAASNPYGIEPGGTFDPGNALTDIVCFCADDDAFTQNVRGPFCLVHACGAIADNGAGNVQAWLGVPGATWVEVPAAGSLALGETYLYVYYVVEPEPPRDTESPQSTVIEGVPLGACPGGLTSTAVGPNPLPNPLSTAVSPGIAARRFRLGDIHAEIVNLPKAQIVPELLWTYYSTTWAPVTGECLGYVELYVGNTDVGFLGSSASGGVVPFRDWIGATVMPNAGVHGDAEVRPVDPMPLRCEVEPERPTLFFAALPSSPENADAIVVMDPESGEYSGHGIWTARSLLAGESLTVVGRVVTRRVVAETPGTIFWINGAPALGRQVRAEGQVAHAPSGGYFVDPDPVVIEGSGATRVYFGQGDYLGASGALQLVDGEGVDACPELPPAVRSSEFPPWVGVGVSAPTATPVPSPSTNPSPAGPQPLCGPLWLWEIA